MKAAALLVGLAPVLVGAAPLAQLLEERGRVWFFDGHCVERRYSHNTAWIDKGTLKGKP